MIRLSQREKQLIFILVVLVMFALTFKFGYMGVVEKSNALEAENISVYSKVQQLNTLIGGEEAYSTQIEKMAEEIQLIEDKYGAKNTPEKTLAFFHTIETITAMEIKDIAFGETMPVGMTSAENSEQEGNTGEAAEELVPVGDIRLYCSPVTVRYSTSYEGLKAAIKVINKCPERMTIESINTAYDQGTGKLSGSFVLNMYEISGTEKKYRAPVIEDMPLGRPLPFGVN